MAISYIHPATGDRVSKEMWRWVAVFEDGTELHQFEFLNGKATFHRFDEINPTHLKSLRMEADGFTPLTVIIPTDAKPIHFYRNFSLENGAHVFKYYFAGYELRGVKVLLCINDLNQISVVSDPDHVGLTRG